MASVGTFFTFGVQGFSILSLYMIFETHGYSTASDRSIVLIIMVMIMTLQMLLFNFIYEHFFNLNFINSTLILARPSDKKYEYFKLLQPVVLAALSLQKNYNQYGQIFSYLAITLMSCIWLYRIIQGENFYNPRLNVLLLNIQIIKTSYQISLVLSSILQFKIQEFLILLVIVSPIIYGIGFILNKRSKDNLFKKLIRGELKKESEYEVVLYQALEYLQSKNSIDQQRFLSIMMNFEEYNIGEENMSYYKQITEIIKAKLNQFNVHSPHQEEKEELIDNEKSNFTNFMSTDFGGSQNIDYINQIQQQQPPSVINVENVEDDTINGAQKSIFRSVMSLYNQIYNSEQGNSSLTELFSSDALTKKRLKEEQKVDKLTIEVDGKSIDISNFSKAINSIKIEFLYQSLSKAACNIFPNNQTIMFFKAYVTMILMQNKHLTLTTVTHIHTNSKKSGYVRQIESQISQNYFLNLSAQKSTSAYDDLDATTMLEQSLQINEILIYIKDCTQKIGIFWQIMSSESISREQIEELLEISEEISHMLQKIKNFLTQMASIDNFQSSCQSLYFYLNQFYSIVLRDQNQGQAILKHMLNMRTLGIQSSLKNSLIDETGLVVVDGDFSLYGVIRFANKTILKQLGYKSGDLIEQRIHSLMPEKISEIHNKFWIHFADVGIPKVLEQVRYLYVKDKEGFIYPYKIFIKFMYHPTFGYCFTGVFRKPKNIIFDDQEPPVKIRKSFTLICNNTGKILDISKSCSQLMKITPQILERFHNSLNDSFTLTQLNSQLVIQNLDFEKNNCYFFRFINLNLGNLRKLGKIIEINEEFDSENDIFQGMRTNIKVQMKILKETYGITNAKVTLFYVIFSEFNANQNTLHALQSSPLPYQRLSLLGQTIASNGGLSVSEQESMNESDNIFFGSKDDQYKLSSIQGKSISTDSIMGGNSSISSSYSQSKSQSDQYQEIKYIEEGIDYEKIPRPLLFLKISLLLLMLISITLSCIQFGLNNSKGNENLAYQKMLQNTIKSSESMSSLTLMFRSYLNINLGLELNSNEYFSNRKKLIESQSFELIENIRVQQKELQQFIHEISLKSAFSDHFNNKNMNIYEMYLNGTIYTSKNQQFYSLNAWLVKLNDILFLDNAVSIIGSYINISQNQTFTPNDQSAFFILINQQQDFQARVQELTNNCQILINEQVTQSNFLNKIYVIITSIIIVIFTLVGIYFLIFVLQFKYKVLGFFAELERPVLQMNEVCANEFAQFFHSDDFSIIKRNLKMIEDHETSKTQQKVINIMKSNEINKQQTRSQIQKKFIKKLKLRAKLNRRFNIKRSSLEVDDEDVIDEELEYQNSDEEEEKKEDQSFRDQKDEQNIQIDKPQKNSQKTVKFYNNDSMNLDKTSTDLIKNKEKQDPIKLKQLSIDEDENQENNDALTPYIYNKLVLSRLKELRNRRISQLLILGGGISFFLIVYFIVQYILFDYSQTNLNKNSQILRYLSESLECTSDFIYSVRDFQTSNSTKYQYNLKNSFILQKIDYIEQLTNLNHSYQDCINSNQYVEKWIQNYEDGEHHLKSDYYTICDYLNQQGHFRDENISQKSYEKCKLIYTGILKKNVLQQSSLFLQDALYQAIKFQSQPNKTYSYIKDSLMQKSTIELLDAISFYQQYGLRLYYQDIFDELISQQSTQMIIVGIFIVFLVFTIVASIIINSILITKIRLKFWNAFYILRLLPRDEISKEFIKRINIFLSKA